MSKKWIIILVVMLVLTNLVQGVLWFRNKANTVASYEAEQTALVAQLQAYGDDVKCYTVKTSVKPGDTITTDNIEAITYPSSYVTDQMITNPSEIYGKLFKVTLAHGTPITYNMVMEDDVRADTRDYDIVLDMWPVGLTAGDYIDINVEMPYGDRYIVVPYKRVYEVNENTLKVHFTAGELDTYLGALVDEALNAEYGCTMFATRYVEPGLQDEAVAYYAVPNNIAALIQKNPNIVDKEELSKTNEWRSSIEELLTIFRDTEDTVDADGKRLAEQRAAYAESVMTDVNSRRDEEEQNGVAEESDNTNGDEFGWEEVSPAEMSNAVENEFDELEDAAGGTD